MLRSILLASCASGLAACTQMKTAATPAPSSAARLEGNKQVMAETNSLNHLTRIAIDANTLYDEASAEADDAQLKIELKALAAQRKSFAQKLQTRVAALGGTPSENGEPVGTVHRSFTALRGLVENDSVAAAGEVYRGESYMIDELGKTLEASLTPISKQLVEAELANVKTGRNRVEAMQASIQGRLKTEDSKEDAAEDAAEKTKGDAE
ncbi:MAG: PA2169 family four-helix-bundle protein [Alphaproteobacteria bacterium]|nr:PA2169 family four-helix-bundle protein [Alphaproteobacteria bacterium]